jgi:5-formyltetrahydrofolate cyclo-ligase
VSSSQPDPQSTDSLARRKDHARMLARTARASAYLATPGAGNLLRDRFFAELLPQLPVSSIVSAYMPIRDEIDARPLMERLFERGLTVAVPALAGAGAPLTFRRWEPFMTLVPGQLDVLVPLLAFDRAGNRLGYGRGYYDRTLAALRKTRRVTAVGLAFAAQEMLSVPAGDGDQRLDWVLTETALIHPRAECDPATDR